MRTFLFIHHVYRLWLWRRWSPCQCYYYGELCYRWRPLYPADTLNWFPRRRGARFITPAACSVQPRKCASVVSAGRRGDHVVVGVVAWRAHSPMFFLNAHVDKPQVLSVVRECYTAKLFYLVLFISRPFTINGNKEIFKLNWKWNVFIHQQSPTKYKVNSIQLKSGETSYKSRWRKTHPGYNHY